MTEVDWLNCIDVRTLLTFLKTSRRADGRKLRLFRVACWRRWRRQLQALNWSDESTQAAIEQRELSADTANIPPSKELRAARAEAELSVSMLANKSTDIKTSMDIRKAERALQACQLRDIYGNPFRPASVEPAVLAWKSGLATKLARAIYDHHDFGLMPVLADALEEAGCTDSDILAHCRGSAEHVRGCWVVDLLLGKP